MEYRVLAARAEGVDSLTKNDPDLEEAFLLQFSQITWRGSQKLVLQSCFLGPSRSGGRVRISILEPNLAPCPVWSVCPDGAATFRQV